MDVFKEINNTELSDNNQIYIDKLMLSKTIFKYGFSKVLILKQIRTQMGYNF